MNKLLHGLTRIKNKKIRRIALLQYMLHIITPAPKFQITIDNYSEEDFISFFRFSKTHFILLIEIMKIPSKIVLQNKATVTNVEGLLILLKRMSYPCRLKDLSVFFGKSKTVLSYTIRYMVYFILSKYEILLDFDHSRLVNKVEMFAEAIYRKNGVLQNVFGFIDGTARPMCRPKVDQKDFFSGHKRYHCIKFQSIVTPDGLIVHLNGPYVGSRHDAGIYNCSNIRNTIGPHLIKNSRQYILYGDPAYPISTFLFPPFKGAVLSEDEVIFNFKMSQVRQCVEWGFSKVVNLFAFVDFRKNLKLFKQPIDKYYKVAVILTNIHSCLYRNQTSYYFDVEAPTVQDYLHSQNIQSIYFFVYIIL